MDLAIVGAGPCGIAVGAAAVRAGLRPLLLDRGPLCDSLVRYPPYMSFFSTSDKLEIEGVPLPTPEKNPTRREALAYYRKVTEYFGLSVRLYEEVKRIRGKRGDFLLRTRCALAPEGVGAAGEKTIRARNVVVATGGFHEPNALNVPGEDLTKVRHYYSEPHPYWDQDVVVVGGGNSAVEAALELFRGGARVTLVHFLEDFDTGVKPWILPDIRNRLEKGEIQVRWRRRVREIRPRTLVLSPVDGPLGTPVEGADPEELPNDFVLALTGWAPDPELLRQVGVPVDPETGIPSHDPATMETAVPGIFIAGVLAAGHDANRIFIENGRWHGRRIVASLAG